MELGAKQRMIRTAGPLPLVAPVTSTRVAAWHWNAGSTLLLGGTIESVSFPYISSIRSFAFANCPWVSFMKADFRSSASSRGSSSWLTFSWPRTFHLPPQLPKGRSLHPGQRPSQLAGLRFFRRAGAPQKSRKEGCKHVEV